jgi:cysteine-rich repeat protein
MLPWWGHRGRAPIETRSNTTCQALIHVALSSLWVAGAASAEVGRTANEPGTASRGHLEAMSGKDSRRPAVSLSSDTTFVDDLETGTFCNWSNVFPGSVGPCPACGNGVAEATEECDDADDLLPGDGCTACEIDFGYLCDVTPQPSVCTPIPTLGTFAPAEAIPTVEAFDPLGEGESDRWLITFSAPVLLSGSLTAADEGDLDLFVSSEGGIEFASEAAGDEDFSDQPLGAATYELRILAFDAAEGGYTLELSTLPDGPSLGTFAAGEAIPQLVRPDPLAEGESEWWSITFTEDVLLSGVLETPGVEDIDFLVWEGGELVFAQLAAGDESWSDEPLSAGTYLLEVLAFEAVPDGYLLDLATTANPPP